MGDKAQIHTLEGFTAAFIVLFALLYGVQAIAITPTSSSTASQEVEQHNYKMIGDFLQTAKANGALRDAILEWDNSTGEPQFNGSIVGEIYYSGRTQTFRPPGEFGEILYILDRRGLAYDVELICDNRKTVMVNNGEPSLNSVSTSVTLQLYDNETVNSGEELWELGRSNFLEDCSNIDGNVYNIVEVRIVAWRQ